MKNDARPAKAVICFSPTGQARRDPGIRRDECAMGRSGRLPLARLAAVVIAFLCLTSGPLRADDSEGFRSVTGPCNFVFPRDHGAHPGYRTEWWYYTGHLTADSGARFGFQLTFFRRQLLPEDALGDWPDPASAWRTNQIYLAHAALTDIDGGRHVMAEKISREGPGLAGALRNGDRIRIALHGWETVIAPEGHTLRMADQDFAFALTLRPTKGPVAHGERGYSRKGDRLEQASCYYSFSRLAAQGQVTLKGQAHAVTGMAWMDHEFSTAPLAQGITGWDWFSIQLDNGFELMLFRLRRADGSLHPASSGTLIGPDGATRHLSRQDIRTRATRRWTSPQSGATYPLAWEIMLPGEGLTLQASAALDDQEMITTGSAGVTYWEGSLTVTGKAGAAAVSGRGYLELTGYAEPEAPPL
jgi:predicted secreted hydrolase